jgi:hypothetical protein
MPVSKIKSAPSVAMYDEIAAASKALAPAVKRLAKAVGSLDPMKLPQGAVTDLLYDLRGVGKLLSTLIAPFEDVLTPAVKMLEEHFVNTLAVGESSGLQGMYSRVQITESVIPLLPAENKEAFYKYVARTKQWDLLPSGVNRAAVLERWTNKAQVPGVSKLIHKRVSCTKLSGKKVG